MKPDDMQWPQVLPLLPGGSQACNTMVSERIQPVSEASRQLLVEKYCPEEMRDTILKSRENQAYLVRIYLGSQRHVQQTERQVKFFSLRNFPLHVNQVKEMNLPAEKYAKAMGEALAFMHWQLRIDASDVEFVLGAAREEDGRLDENDNVPLGRHALWLLDFDCCKPIDVNGDCITPIVRSFWRNDPYYPLPNGTTWEDHWLWEIFESEYRRVGLEAVQSSRREGEDVDHLTYLVHTAMNTIQATRGDKFTRA